MSENQRPMHWMCAALYGHFGLWAHSLRTVLIPKVHLLSYMRIVESQQAV